MNLTLTHKAVRYYYSLLLCGRRNQSNNCVVVDLLIAQFKYLKNNCKYKHGSTENGPTKTLL